MIWEHLLQLVREGERAFEKNIEQEHQAIEGDTVRTIIEIFNIGLYANIPFRISRKRPPKNVWSFFRSRNGKFGKWRNNLKVSQLSSMRPYSMVSSTSATAMANYHCRIPPLSITRETFQMQQEPMHRASKSDALVLKKDRVNKSGWSLERLL